MKITLFGATGRTGSLIMKKALKDKMQVIAFTRSADRIIDENPLLQIMEGDILEPHSVEKAIKGSDAVVFAIGADDISKPIRLFSEGIKNVIKAMHKAGVKRILAITGAGVLDHPSGELRGEVDLAPFLRFVYPDQKRVYEALEDSGLEWTLICPTFMPEGKETGQARIAENVLPEDARAVPVADVATILFNALKENKFLKTRIGIAI
jgi:putative NADH-flavin reductase